MILLSRCTSFAAFERVRGDQRSKRVRYGRGDSGQGVGQVLLYHAQLQTRKIFKTNPQPRV